jgi:alpha-tubulin suppressor-like RCC1 family protein
MIQIHIAGDTICTFLKKNQKILLNNNIFSYGQIGDGTTINRLLPTAVNNQIVLNGKNIIQISISGYHSCAIANDSNSYCWGYN